MIELMLAAFVGAFLGSFIVMWATLALDRKRLRQEIEASAPPWINDPAKMFDRDSEEWQRHREAQLQLARDMRNTQAWQPKDAFELDALMEAQEAVRLRYKDDNRP